MDDISTIRAKKMALQILKSDELREAQKEARRQKKILSQQKTKPSVSPEDLGGYADGERTYRISDITEPNGFVREFRKIVSSKHPRARFPSPNNIVHEVTAAATILDVLLESNCRDRDTIRTWIEWFSSKKLNPERVEKYPVSVRELLSSWKDFSKVRISQPKHTPPTPKKTVKGDIIGDRMAEIFSQGFSYESLMMVCQIFGIVLAANYIRKFVKPDVKVLEFIRDVLSSEENERKLKSVVLSTARYDVDRIQDGNVLLSDWRVWMRSVMNIEVPPPQGLGQEAIVKLFFDNLEETA